MHPEFEGTPEGELLKFIEQTEVVDVWCKGCGAFRKMNANYAKYLDGEIESCGKCRKA